MGQTISLSKQERLLMQEMRREHDAMMHEMQQELGAMRLLMQPTLL